MRRPTIAETLSFVIGAIFVGWILLWVRAWLRVVHIPFFWTIWDVYVLVVLGAGIMGVAGDLLFNWSGNTGSLRGKLFLLLRAAVTLPTIYGLGVAVRSADAWLLNLGADIILAAGYVGSLSFGIHDVLRTDREPSASVSEVRS